MNCFCKDETQSAEPSGVSMIFSGDLGDKKKSFLTKLRFKTNQVL
jgi:hypothetical protein